VNHSKPVKERLEKRNKKIEAFFLPLHLPELNSDEYLNYDLKAGVHSGVPAKTKGQLKNQAISER
jgi:hypothetical protein